MFRYILVSRTSFDDEIGSGPWHPKRAELVDILRVLHFSQNSFVADNFCFILCRTEVHRTQIRDCQVQTYHYMQNGSAYRYWLAVKAQFPFITPFYTHMEMQRWKQDLSVYGSPPFVAFSPKIVWCTLVIDACNESLHRSRKARLSPTISSKRYPVRRTFRDCLSSIGPLKLLMHKVHISNTFIGHLLLRRLHPRHLVLTIEHPWIKRLLNAACFSAMLQR